jgi:hypothetical protein
MSETNQVPFFEKSHKIQEEGWGGAENTVSSIAFDVPEGTKPESVEYDHVLKEPAGANIFEALAEKFPPSTESEEQAINDLIEYSDSKESFINSKNDYEAMKEIFGDLLADTQYIIGKPRGDNELGFYILQDKVKGSTWTEFSKGKDRNQNQESIMQQREQLIELTGGARKALVELGATVDIWGANLMVDENENFVLIDPGTPSELERHFDTLLALPKNMRSNLAENLIKRVDDLDKYSSTLEMTKDEIESMNESAGITDEQYEGAKKGLRDRCEQLAK